jgi:hypothetical protein
MKLVWKLLRENISRPQLIGFFCANLFGMTIVLLAIQFYSDINPVFTGKDELFKQDYFTITKKVSILSSLSSKSGGFSQDEIGDLKRESFVKDVGAFTPSRFSVFAGINSAEAGVGFNTQMFFESIPDKFIDVKTEDWHFSPVDNSIPIILPKNYLDLYNFGFAEANSLPKISEGLIGMISLDITIVGKNNQVKRMKGRIVAFSNRINTILVPESFMEWANKELGGDAQARPSRIMAEISNIADPNLSSYFKERGYEISNENATASKMSFFLKIVVSIVAAIGVVICVLSFFILVLSIYLLLEKNMSKLRTLRLIGYSKQYVVKPYVFLSIGLNAAILVIALAVVFVARAYYLDMIGKLFTGNEVTFPVWTIVSGIAIFLILSVFNTLIIRSKVE